MVREMRKQEDNAERVIGMVGGGRIKFLLTLKSTVVSTLLSK